MTPVIHWSKRGERQHEILFIHPNFPAQFRNLSLGLIDTGQFRIHGLRSCAVPFDSRVKIHTHNPDDLDSKSLIPKTIHPWLAPHLDHVMRAESAYRKLLTLKREGLNPSVIICHGGWGDQLAIRDIFPNAILVGYPEFFYHNVGADVGFDGSDGEQDLWEAGRIAFRNSLQLHDLYSFDWGIAPTWWQWSVMPRAFQPRFSVIHEGIQTSLIKANSAACFRLKRKNLVFHKGDEIVTYISRNLEQYRGFPTFMRMLPELLERRPNAHVLIAGGKGSGYGPKPPGDHQDWKSAMLKEVGCKLDQNRVHFVGNVPHQTLHEIFQVSACHVYLTVPFVLSWSLLEAMACECTIVASSTPPVCEVISNGVNGILTDFNSPAKLADAVVRVLESPDESTSLGKAARAAVVENYDFNRICLPKYLELFETLLQGHEPLPPCPPAAMHGILFRPPHERLVSVNKSGASQALITDPSDQ